MFLDFGGCRYSLVWRCVDWRRYRVIVLALALLLIQSYVWYSSTFHTFHNSMPMCPICVALKNYESSAISAVHTSIPSFVDTRVDAKEIPQIQLTHTLVYYSRAPPRGILTERI